MKGDTIKCLTCGKTFKDTTQKTDKLTEAGNTYQWTGQDSREGNFKNMCPFCYGTDTKNTHKKTKEKAKFIYGSDTKGEESHSKTSKKIIKKPNLNNEAITKEAIGWRQPFDVKESKRHLSKKTDTKTFVTVTGGTFTVQRTKSLTPIELMEYKLKAQHKELLSPPDNLSRYRGWRYDKKVRHGRNN